MFDWLQNWRKSPEEKEQEAITAYLDGALSDRETADFEARLRDNAALRTDVEAQRAVKQLLRQAPRLRAPRSFVLDPAVYARQKPRPLPLSVRLYPQLRTATVVASFLFAAVLTLNLFTQRGPTAMQDVAMAPAASESQRIEQISPTAAVEMAAESAAVEVEVVEEVEEEEMALLTDEEAADEAALLELTAIPEIQVESEAAAAPAEPALAGESTAADAPPVGDAPEADASGADDGSEFVAPRATATPDGSRASEESAADEDEAALSPQATAAANPTATVDLAGEAEQDGALSEAAVAELPQEASEATETTPIAADRNPGLTLWAWAAVFFGVLALLLLGLTVWARRQMRP